MLRKQPNHALYITVSTLTWAPDRHNLCELNTFVVAPTELANVRAPTENSVGMSNRVL